MMIRLRRLLWPIRPILLPIWRPMRSAAKRGETRWISVADRVAFLVRGAADRLGGRSHAGRRIRPLRRFELLDLGRRIPYYQTRSIYMSMASRVAEDLIRRHGLTTALELGPYLRPLIIGADVLDLAVQADREAEGRTIIHDATRLPWPVDDGAYDLFVGLQVFEHLGTSQADVFREVRRVARHAILSLPIDWQMSDPRNCHHGITAERALSWFAPVAPTRVVVGNGGRRKRLIFVFEGLEPAGPQPTEPENAEPKTIEIPELAIAETVSTRVAGSAGDAPNVDADTTRATAPARESVTRA
jgi:hypothetical protein